MTPRHGCGVYHEHHWLTTVYFRTAFERWLFHVLLNRSIDHNGTIE